MIKILSQPIKFLPSEISDIIEFISPSILQRNNLIQGLKHKNNFIKYINLNIILVIFKRLSEVKI